MDQFQLNPTFLFINFRVELLISTLKGRQFLRKYYLVWDKERFTEILIMI